MQKLLNPPLEIWLSFLQKLHWHSKLTEIQIIYVLYELNTDALYAQIDFVKCIQIKVNFKMTNSINNSFSFLKQLSTFSLQQLQSTAYYFYFFELLMPNILARLRVLLPSIMWYTRMYIKTFLIRFRETQ